MNAILPYLGQFFYPNDKKFLVFRSFLENHPTLYVTYLTITHDLRQIFKDNIFLKFKTGKLLNVYKYNGGMNSLFCKLVGFFTSVSVLTYEEKKSRDNIYIRHKKGRG